MSNPTVTEIAASLIRIPSVNPDGGEAGADATGEIMCAEWVANFLEQSGAEVRLDEVLPGRPNVVARFANPGASQRILLAPHLDTVSIVGMVVDPFGAHIRDGKLYGRGASDTKGSVAAMLWALREMAPQLNKLSAEIWFAGLMGEEVGQFGSRALAEKMKFDFMIAGEPTRLNIVHTHKGNGLLTLRSRGKAAHASRPETGLNAISNMAKAISEIEEKIAPEFSALEHSVLGHSTLSVTTIHGGTKANIIPDFCEVQVNLRTVPGSRPEMLVEKLKERFPALEVTLNVSPAFYTAPEHPQINSLRQLGSSLEGAPWYCDAAVFAERGTPAVALGPGSIDQAHTADEFIAVEDLEAGGQYFYNYLSGLRVK